MRIYRPNRRDRYKTIASTGKLAKLFNKENDYYRISTVLKPSEARYMAIRLSQSRLEQLHDSLSLKDKEILDSLSRCRYLMTGQIQRLHFYDSIHQGS